MLLSFLSDQHITMHRASDFPLFRDRFLQFQQTVETRVNGKTRKFPFDDPGKPDKRADIIKIDPAICFSGIQNIETGLDKTRFLPVQIQIGIWSFYMRQYRFHKVAVVIAADLLGDKQAAGT